MDIDIEKNWNIKPDKVEEFKGLNPYSDEEKCIINDSYFLKSMPKEKLEQKEKEREVLNKLNQNNIPVQVCEGNKTVVDGDKIYQLFKFVKGNSGTINYEKNSAIFLAQELSKLSKLPRDAKKESVQDVLEELKDELEEKIPEEYRNDLSITYNYLNKNLFPYLKYFDYKISHGDLHPGNILWKDDKVASIIDWQLFGLREELYDLAFLLGCIGIEEPDNFDSKWVNELIENFVEHAKPSKLAFSLLPELMIATRLNWLHKWVIIQDDKEIIEMEITLINIIITAANDIREKWLSYSNSDFKFSESNWIMQDAMMVEDIKKAKQKFVGFDYAKKHNDYPNQEELAATLRLFAIDYGMNNDILSVLKTLDVLKKVYNNNMDNQFILIELVIAMGNSCLDFSKFRMVNAIDYTYVAIKEIISKNKNIDELNIGYAFSLRNASIAFAEVKDFDKFIDSLDELIKLTKKHSDNIEIQGELARALSNAITTILSNKLDMDHMKYFNMLEEIYNKHKSRKINGAYQVAKVNLKK